mmetsp:Transcript_129875/g.277267  ORF Transcript_129875/g.277267 Transcript_129875/m.277267 type:complete len:203 (-) Transcript_129875:63-671(-)
MVAEDDEMQLLCREIEAAPQPQGRPVALRLSAGLVLVGLLALTVASRAPSSFKVAPGLEEGGLMTLNAVADPNMTAPLSTSSVATLGNTSGISTGSGSLDGAISMPTTIPDLKAQVQSCECSGAVTDAAVAGCCCQSCCTVASELQLGFVLLRLRATGRLSCKGDGCLEPPWKEAVLNTTHMASLSPQDCMPPATVAPAASS